jgi:hypothetical protein
MSEKIRLGVMRAADAERLKSKAELQGVEVLLLFNQQTCTSGGCGTSFEVWAAAADVPVLQKIFLEDQQRNMQGLVYDMNLSDNVFDADKESATCPACGTVFSTKSKECPDCGLHFG